MEGQVPADEVVQAASSHERDKHYLILFAEEPVLRVQDARVLEQGF